MCAILSCNLSMPYRILKPVYGCEFGGGAMMYDTASAHVSLVARASPAGANLTLSVVSGVFEWERGDREANAQFRFIAESTVFS